MCVCLAAHHALSPPPSPGLSPHFIMMDDDLFLTAPWNRSDFIDPADGGQLITGEGVMIWDVQPGDARGSAVCVGVGVLRGGGLRDYRPVLKPCHHTLKSNKRLHSIFLHDQGTKWYEAPIAQPLLNLHLLPLPPPHLSHTSTACC
jgi:hypothetical protein